ncbi:MAG: response regulator [Candidatus Riflebacteria bacterium]|nr:response regulator [Candidatus Riflebacteria bacterium]
MRNLQISELIYLPEIEKTLKLFSQLLSISVAIADSEGHIVYQTGKPFCSEIQKISHQVRNQCIFYTPSLISKIKSSEPVSKICQIGVRQVVTPFFFQNEPQAYLIFTNFLCEGEESNFQHFKVLLEKYEVSSKDFSNSTKNLPVFKREKFTTLVEFSKSLAETLSSRAHKNLRLMQETKEKLKIENQLKENQNKFDQFLNSTEIVHWEFDSNAGEMKTGKIWHKITEFGENAPPATLNYWKENIHPEDLPGTIKSFNDHLNGQSQMFESIYRFQTRTGHWKLLLDHGKTVVRDDFGKAIKIVGARIDISGIKGVDKNEIQAKLSLEEINHLKERFLANVSHEIRTPLNGIIGMTGLMVDSNLTPKQQEYAEVIRRCSTELLSLVNDLLDFSKIENGKIDIEEFSFDIRTMMEDVSHLIEEKVRKKGLELICRVNSEVPSIVEGDPGRIRQVLICLAENAIKFSTEGTISISVILEKETENRVFLTFSTSDTGVGIPKEKQDFLFQAFSQVDPSATRKVGGLGLGLSLAMGIVKKLQGIMGFESLPQKGSRFWFTISLKKVTLLEESQKVSTLSEGLVGKRILVVEDSLASQEVLNEILSTWKCNCHFTLTGQEGMKALEEASKANQPFSIAILDMALPDMTGEVLGQEIRNKKGIEKTGLILLTSVSLRGDAKRLREIGFDAYLPKPAKKSILYDCLLSVLERFEKPSSKPVELITRHSIAEKRKQKVRILVAEDNITNQKVALGILEKLGFRADAVANGVEAIKSLSTVPYDLVFMDLQMPEMDGFEATSLIRQPNSPVMDHNIPIIAMTAHALKGSREQCLEVGMNDYITKPVSSQDLLNSIKKHLPITPDDPLAPPRPKENIDPVFDQSSLLERLGNDELLCKQIIQVFVDDAPKQLQSILEAIQQKDVEQVIARSRTLKGASANVCAIALNKLIEKLEASAQANDFPEIVIITEKLETEIGAFKETAVHAFTH